MSHPSLILGVVLVHLPAIDALVKIRRFSTVVTNHTPGDRSRSFGFILTVVTGDGLDFERACPLFVSRTKHQIEHSGHVDVPGLESCVVHLLCA